MATKRDRYMISVDNDMFNAIENFRYERRYPTRSEATTELIRLGLEVLREQSMKAQTTAPEQPEPAPKEEVLRKRSAMGGESEIVSVDKDFIDKENEDAEIAKILEDEMLEAIIEQEAEDATKGIKGKH